jgi:hypothetical protein
MIISAVLLAATLASTPVPHDRARRTFDEIRIASEEDGGRLWGKPLYGPMILVDPRTRYAVANVVDGGDVLKADGPLFVGTLPSAVVIANYATEWNGVRWTMVMWDSVAERSVPRRRLLLHECFHRIQNDLGLPAAPADNPHMDSLDGRYWFLLELRALSAALRDENRQTAIADALAFRAKRQTLFPAAAANERALENNEGLAEYTGVVLRGTSDEETRLSIARRLDLLDRGDSFVRSFAYSTGPAYGLLLDVAAPDWRRAFKSSDGMAEMLGKTVKINPPADTAARAAAYGGAKLRAEEEQRAREQNERVAKYRARLVDGPVLEIPLDGAHYGFDPYTVVPLGDSGTVYPKLEVTGQWGKITTESGARVAPDAKLIFGADDRSRLTLNPGWKLKPGRRAGDLVLIPDAK